MTCGLAEALVAACAAGSVAAEGAALLQRHLERCPACRHMARELEAPALAEALSDAGEADEDFVELTTVASDTYVRGEEIGRGGMGHIVRARDRRLGRHVAIKQLIDERLGRRFEHEARLTARLQHPAIVPIYEAGRWPSGEPFYAMKYVAGRPLDQVIAGMKRLDERLALLANVTTVVEAIAYAHSEGVVHRDLKPQNILIGPFGETVVIDWGLAKDLAGAPGAGTPFRTETGLLTVAGAGTPAYMAPEQERGEPPDERVDVYALGATLHHVLAGERPDLRGLPPETPRELRDIVAKAMAPNKEDRYPTAAELAGELKRFQNGQLVAAHRYTAAELVRRWLRRHRTLVAVSSGFALTLGVVASLSVRRIVDERDRADSQRAAAEQLVDYMLGTLRGRLQDINRLDVLEGLGSQVQRYYADSKPGDPADATMFHQRADALLILGDVESDKGNEAQATSLYQSAMATVDEGIRRFGAGAAASQQRAQLKMRLGDLDLAIGRFAQATQLFKEGLDDADAAVEAEPANAVPVRLAGLIRMRLGDAARRSGDFEGARGHYIRLLDDSKRALQRWPSINKELWLVGWAQSRLGVIDSTVGRLDEARPELLGALETRSELARREPKSLQYQEELAMNRLQIGELASREGQVDESAQRFRDTIDLLAGPVQADPSNVSLNQYLIFAEDGECLALLDGSHVTEAIAHCQRAIALEQPKTATTNIRQMLAGARRKLAVGLALTGRLEEAVALVHRADDDLSALVRESPSEWHYACERESTVIALARIDAQAGRLSAALVEASEAAQRLDDLVGKSQPNELVQATDIEAWRTVGDLARNSRLPDRAGEAYRRAVTRAGSQTGARLRGQVALAYMGLAALGDVASLAKAKEIVSALKANGRLYPSLADELARAKILSNE